MYLPNIFQWSLLLGTLTTLLALVVLAGPKIAPPLLYAFPRHKWTGRCLAVLAWLGAAWATAVMPLAFLEPYKRFLPILVLVCVPLSWYWLEELLPCRASGGILMLFPAPLLMATRQHYSSWRLLLVVYAYIAIVAGMTFMLYPWHLRRLCHRLAASARWREVVGTVVLALGFSIIVVGMVALRK